jgi:ATP-dependent Clp protease ATP-binding subunit ClpC
MPRTFKYTAFLWRTGNEFWTGRLLDQSAAVGSETGPSPEAVVKGLKSLINDLHNKYPWLSAPDLNQAEVRVLKVRAVPEYQLESDPNTKRKRILPCKEPVELRLPYVVAKLDSGLISGHIPSLDLEFQVTRMEEVAEMALHYARSELKGLSPAALLRFLPPTEWRLETIAYTPRKSEASQTDEKLTHLPKIADHVGSPALRRSSRIWERETDAARLEQRLRQPTGSVLLVGESGCGKTSVLMEAARRVEKLTGTSGPAKQRYWMTAGSRIIAGMRYLGQWEERLEEALAELRTMEGVLCVESLRELIHYGGRSTESSIAAFLIPYLQSGELRLVLEATPAEMDACEKSLPAFLDAFSIQRIEPLATSAEERLLQLAATSTGSAQSVDFHADAAREAGRLCKRFQPYAGFPGAALSLLQDAALQARERGSKVVTVGDLRRLFGQSTGLPDHLLDETVPLAPSEVRAWFAERLIAQEAATDAVCRAVLKFKSGLNDPRRPLAVLLFAGPTGTGKTQLARFLGDYLFPNRKESERMVRLDMSEYSGRGAASRLLGDAFGEASDLVKRIRQNPFTVLLLDEIEKAAPEVFDTLMNVFDEGRLTDALGRQTWFCSTVIIMTSNLGTKKGGSLGFGSSSIESARSDMSAIRQFFRPEFFNRLDQVVTFDPLSETAIRAIARREIAGIETREGLNTRDLKLEVSAELFAQVCANGFDPVYGARPLQRKIEELIVGPISRWLVENSSAQTRTLHVTRSGVKVG